MRNSLVGRTVAMMAMIALTCPVWADVAVEGCQFPVCRTDYFGEAGARTLRREEVDAIIRRRAMSGLAVPEARPALGLALAGGGTRASQIGIGILQGLHRANLLDKVDIISSVSGGSYAAYWYFAQRLQDQKDDDMFRDCVPVRYRSIAQAAGLQDCSASAGSADGKAGRPSRCICPLVLGPARNGNKGEPDTASNRTNVLLSGDGAHRTVVDPFRHQNNLRGHIDLFAPGFNYEVTGEDGNPLASALGMAAAQIPFAIPFDGISDVLFDWNSNLSVSKERYRAGIGRVYGQVPIDCGAFLNNRQDLIGVATKDGERCEPVSCVTERKLLDEVELERSSPPRLPTEPPLTVARVTERVSFADLRERYRGKGDIPYWIINATTPVLGCDPNVFFNLDCFVNTYLSRDSYPPYLAGFEISAFSWGSGEHGYRSSVGSGPHAGKDAHGLTLLDAVSASAAFFDPNEKSVSLGGLVSVLQQLGGFRWGYYIPNPNVTDDARALHKLLPFPLYLMHRWRETRDSVDIHLIDGGQNDNLGLYPLIRRRTRNIVVSDHAEDADGRFDDVCNIKNWLVDAAFAKHNAGYVWVIHFDDLPDLERMCDPSAKNSRPVWRYNLLAWRYPVQGGCAVEMRDAVYRDRVFDHLPMTCAELARFAEPSETLTRDAAVLNLFLIKPAIDLSKAICSLEDLARLPHRAECGSRGEAANPNSEILGFLEKNRCRYEPSDVMLFPRHGTIEMTFNSSPWLYGAYRELAADAAGTLSWSDGAWRLSLPAAGAVHAAQSDKVERMQRKDTAALRQLDLTSLARGDETERDTRATGAARILDLPIDQEKRTFSPCP